MSGVSESSNRPRLSVAIITLNEEANLARTLASVTFADQIVILDSGSTDRTAAIAAEHNASFFTEPWRGFGAQKNAALKKCNGDWILSLDADEVVSPELTQSIRKLLGTSTDHAAYFIARRNLFLGRWMKHGGYYPDRKLRLLRRDAAFFEERAVHETLQFSGNTGTLAGDLIHHAYPSLQVYIEHMDRYSTLAIAKQLNQRSSILSFLNGVVLNPLATFFYNYIVRLGIRDGREGLLQHLYHSVYVSWKYAKAWEAGRQ
jgi:glycosyltransferase involved in cell wall biosynthesis